MSRTTGPRFSSGYQFPRTSSVVLRRGRPIKREEIGTGAYAQIVPLTGGRGRFDVCGEWRNRDGVYIQETYLASDELEATAEYVRLINRIRREHHV